MASNLTQFTDAVGRTAWKDVSGKVYNENGNKYSGYDTVDKWNAAQQNQYGKSNSSSSSTGSMGGLDMQSIINNAIKMQQDVAKPAIQQLQSTIPSTQKSFDTRAGQLEAEKQPLQDRYTSLINSIKGNQTTAENRQTVTTNNELGKRGVPLTSGVAQQEVTNAVNPVTQQYTGLIDQAGLAEQGDLRDLTNQITNLGLSKTDSINAINTAIAQLQSGAGQQGISTGLGIYGSNLAQSNADRQYALDKQNAAASASQFDSWLETLKNPGGVNGTGTNTDPGGFVYDDPKAPSNQYQSKANQYQSIAPVASIAPRQPLPPPIDKSKPFNIKGYNFLNY